jgi:hypothetical protein
MIEYKIQGKFRNRMNEIQVHDTDAPNWEARMACILIEHWGMVAGSDGGEDSTGRSKLRLQTPQEIVDRACETAELAVSQFRARGWVATLPTLAEIEAHVEKDAP